MTNLNVKEVYLMYLLVSMVVITYKSKCTCLNIIQQNTKNNTG